MWAGTVTSCMIITMLFQSCFIRPANAGEENSGQDPASVVVLTDVIYLAPSFLTMLWVHETGHFTMAVLSGAQDPRMGLYRVEKVGPYSTNTQFGWMDWKKGSLSPLGSALTDIGGVLFSRGLAEGSDAFVKAVRIPDWEERFFSMTYIISRFDYPRYVLQDAILNLSGRSGSDIDDFVTDVAGRRAGWRVLAYSALLTIATVDIVLDWNRISMHWNSLWVNRFTAMRTLHLSSLNRSVAQEVSECRCKVHGDLK